MVYSQDYSLEKNHMGNYFLHVIATIIINIINMIQSYISFRTSYTVFVFLRRPLCYTIPTKLQTFQPLIIVNVHKIYHNVEATLHSL